MEPMAQGVSHIGELPALYELETYVCPCVTGNYAGNVWGGGMCLIDKQLIVKS